MPYYKFKKNFILKKARLVLRKLKRRRLFSIIITSGKKLTDNQKIGMSYVFSDVMSDLSFTAKPEFLEKLYETDTIILAVENSTGNIVGFSNIVNRTTLNIRHKHIYSTYVMHKYRGYSLMQAMFKKWFLVSIFHNYFKAIYVTASAVNPQVLFALSKYFTVWPDLLSDTEPPIYIKNFALENSNKYYPEKSDRIFQVKINSNFATFSNGITQKTGNVGFDEKFFNLAIPSEYKLCFFIAHISIVKFTIAWFKKLFL